MLFYFNPEVTFLLINESSEMVELIYNDNERSFELPLIGLRPPYFAYPVYEPYKPLI